MSDEAGSVKTVADIEKTADGIVKRWLTELSLADEAEKDYRDESEKLWDLYRAGDKAKSAFAILWSNTDTLVPAIYNSVPQPDVRRRWRDADPVGKAVAQVMERCLSYGLDTEEVEDSSTDAVYDMAVTGRGVMRIGYKPRFAPIESDPLAPTQTDAGPEQAVTSNEGAGPIAAAPGQPQPAEQVIDESAPWEFVPWRDFRRGPGKRWSNVPWVSFRHDMTADMLVESFGPEALQQVKLTENKEGKKRGGNDAQDKEVRQVMQTGEVWEIWDKEQRRVLFIAPSYKDAPLKIVSDPLQLEKFLPMPRPMYAIVDTESLVPIPLYRQYEHLAKELDSVTGRINKITSALKVRGAYVKALSELGDILKAGDLEMVALENLSGITNAGGLDKAIWIMPVDKLINVLRGLYESRQEIKASIYEVIGLSDILRGASDPNETASAQQLKSQWGSTRLGKLKREVARFCRDMVRLQAELIAQQFSQQTLAMISGLQFSTGEEKAAAQQMLSQPQVDPMTGQPMPVDPQMQKAAESPSWDEIMQVLRSDGLRQCRVDVETDSTVAETVQQDTAGVIEVVKAIGEVMTGSAMGLQSGMITIDMVKAICLAIVRRARLGSAVEDAIEQMQQPAPQGPTPEQLAQQEQATADEKQAGGDDRKATQDAVKQLMQTIEQGLKELAAKVDAPKRLKAQADPTGAVNGMVEA